DGADEARDRDLEPVEDPRDAEREHEPGVERRPRQAVHARRHQAPEGGHADASYLTRRRAGRLLGAMPAPIDGRCDPRFAAVREAFAQNFADRGEVGAAVAISIGGRPVVDLWGGWADVPRRTSWRSDTLVNFFSVGKGLSAVCVHRLVERGLLDLDAPIARHWPGFAAAGTDAISLRDVRSHRAGLPAVRAPLADGTMLDWDAMVRALEAQSPWWTPGTAHGYHVNTFGYLIGEVVRRVTGATLGTLLRAEIAGPLGADVHIGLPLAEHHRVAEFLWPPGAPGDVPAALAGDDLMRWNAYWNPRGLSGAG